MTARVKTALYHSFCVINDSGYEGRNLECDKVSKSGSDLPISSNEKPAESTPTSTGNSVPKLRGDNWNGIGTVSPSLSHPRRNPSASLGGLNYYEISKRVIL